MKVRHTIPRQLQRPKVPAPSLATLTGARTLKSDIRRNQADGATEGTQRYGHLIVDEYSYSTPVFSLQGIQGARTTVYITTLDDSFFEILSRQIFTHSNNFSGGGHPLSIAIRDVASGRYLMQDSAAPNVAGKGGLVDDLGQTKKLSPTQMLAFDIVQLAPTDPANDVIGQLTLTGRKVFIRGY